MKLNVVLLQAVRDAIAVANDEDGTGFDMSEWFNTFDGEFYSEVPTCSHVQEKYGTCGTVGCIAGHTVGQAELMGLKCAESVEDLVDVQAQHFLGIDLREAGRLFYAGWSLLSTNSIGRDEVLEYLDRCIEHATIV